ncbi:TolC family protein [Rhodocytophaga aerolata]|uniref:TolC family protein n=1 Tax=Rhodocytophaga aerolata TaxID=455078 RepID=A0ABT8RBX7_9BACT|nr:TolC family protein [Rhodocytophaga aerolata]MDO1449613.1 TolC family protein [Rhodocytophaga aerolata]
MKEKDLYLKSLLLLFCFLWLNFLSIAQDSKDSLSLKQALQLSEENYPSLLAKRHLAQASRNRVAVEKKDALPKLDLHLQANYATLNNIYGIFYPQDIVLPISGPVSNTSNYDPVFGSAGGIRLAWEPITFGQRKASIDQAQSEFRETQSEYTNSIFEHKIQVVETYLNWLTAQTMLKVQHSNLERTQVLYTSVHTLALSGLRPGVDTSMTKAEIAKATVELNKAVEAEKVFLLRLNQEIGYNNDSIRLSSGKVFSIGSSSTYSSLPKASSHPILDLYQARIDIGKSRKSLVNRSYAPRLSFFATGFARGSGGAINENFDYSMSGLSFTKYNYAVGALLTFPILVYPKIRSQGRVEDEKLKAQQLLFQEQQLKLDSEIKVAAVNIQTAIENISQTDLQLSAARDAYFQMQTRYQAGLTTLPELYQSLYELNRAELNYASVIIHLWKAKLYQSYIKGDLSEFLNEIE